MRFLLTIILGLVLNSGKAQQSQTAYDRTLSSRLDQIRNEKYYDNAPVIYVDSADRNDLSFPYWKPTDTFYQGDIARYRYCHYEALIDSTTGHRPDTSRTAWRLINGPHPYLFLRDTAKLEDLFNLMSDKHPHIRSYTFGALSFRNSDKLFSLIVDNLKDTKLVTVSGCEFSSAYPADLMIDYQVSRLTASERQKLIDLITRRYKHLSQGLNSLRAK